MDTVSAERRSVNMSRIRSEDTKPELAVRRQLHRFGFRFRKNDRRYTGSPDLVFPRYRAMLFVNGCFWHGHSVCGGFRLPKTNTDFWRKKIERNRLRDRKDAETLLSQGWRVGVVWECSITGRNRKGKLLSVSEDIALWLEEGFAEPYREF